MYLQNLSPMYVKCQDELSAHEGALLEVTQASSLQIFTERKSRRFMRATLEWNPVCEGPERLLTGH